MQLPFQILKQGILSSLLILLTASIYAGQVNLYQWIPPSGPENQTNFAVCGSGTRSFMVRYDFSSHSSCHTNRYRVTFRLFKNGSLVAMVGPNTSSSVWQNWNFNNITATPGNYNATVTLERRPCIGGWYTAETITSNSISVSTTATPNFNILGVPASAVTTPTVNVCASSILVHASATTCENNYYVDVWETTNIPWERTFQYEWGTWIAGQAPNNINMQQLATNSASYWINGPAFRKNNALIGGNITAAINPAYIGKPRHYNVKICTGEPSFTCKSILIRVDGSCKGDPEPAGGYAQMVPIPDPYAYANSDADMPVSIISEIANEDNVSLFPNPASNELNIAWQEIVQTSAKEILILNQMGQEVLRKNSENQYGDKINIERLSNGIYFVRLSVDGQSKTKRFLKQ